MSIILHRQPKIIVGDQVLNQHDTRYTVAGGEVLRKCCNFDGDDDFATTADIARDTLRANVLGVSLPCTFYFKVKPQATDEAVNIFTLGVFKAGGADTDSRFYVGLRKSSATGNAVLYIVSESPSANPTIATWASTIPFSTDTIYSCAFRFGSTTMTNASNICYINDQSGNLSATGGLTITAFSQLSDVPHVIGMQIITDNGTQAGKSAILIDAAIFPSAKTLAECEADILTAPFRIKANNGQGTVLTNSGTAGTDFNMDLYNTTADNFFTLCKE
jgi:hypothetical protein